MAWRKCRQIFLRNAFSFFSENNFKHSVTVPQFYHRRASVSKHFTVVGETGHGSNKKCLLWKTKPLLFLREHKLYQSRHFTHPKQTTKWNGVTLWKLCACSLSQGTRMTVHWDEENNSLKSPIQELCSCVNCGVAVWKARMLLYTTVCHNWNPNLKT